MSLDTLRKLHATPHPSLFQLLKSTTFHTVSRDDFTHHQSPRTYHCPQSPNPSIPAPTLFHTIIPKANHLQNTPNSAPKPPSTAPSLVQRPKTQLPGVPNTLLQRASPWVRAKPRKKAQRSPIPNTINVILHIRESLPRCHFKALQSSWYSISAA